MKGSKFKQFKNKIQLPDYGARGFPHLRFITFLVYAW